jgi:hypothetical protein
VPLVPLINLRDLLGLVKTASGQRRVATVTRARCGGRSTEAGAHARHGRLSICTARDNRGRRRRRARCRAHCGLARRPLLVTRAVFSVMAVSDSAAPPPSDALLLHCCFTRRSSCETPVRAPPPYQVAAGVSCHTIIISAVKAGHHRLAMCDRGNKKTKAI